MTLYAFSRPDFLGSLSQKDKLEQYWLATETLMWYRCAILFLTYHMSSPLVWGLLVQALLIVWFYMSATQIKWKSWSETVGNTVTLGCKIWLENWLLSIFQNFACCPFYINKIHSGRIGLEIKTLESMKGNFTFFFESKK